MEQSDVVLLKLCNQLKDRSAVTAYMKRSTIRDFKIQIEGNM